MSSKRRRMAEGPTAGKAGKAAKAAKTAIAAPVATRQAVTELEERIMADRRHANDLVTLMELAEDGVPEAVRYAALHALHRCLLELAAYRTPAKKDVKAGMAEFERWAHAQYQDFVALLQQLIADGPAGLQMPAVNIAMDFVAQFGRAQQPKETQFPSDQLAKVVGAVVDTADANDDLVLEFTSKFGQFDDIRHHALKIIAKLCLRPSARAASFVSNVFVLLGQLDEIFPTEPEELDEFFVVAPDNESHPLRLLPTHKRSFSACWLNFLKLPLSPEVFKNVLLILPDQVMPHLVDPKLLIDFLRDSYDMGGATSILALQGVFVLIYHHNLDYPDFYKKLYQLLDAAVFLMKFRSRFFRLMDKFLQSTLLPSYLVAAFIKRLSRLALGTTPAGCMVAVRLIYNLLKRHPSCKVLIHRQGADSVEQDPYIHSEQDPAKCNALSSSLWEVQSLLQHYHPDVARLPEVLETPALAKAEMDMRRASQTTYKSLFAAELKRSSADEEQTPPPTTFVPPTALIETGSGAFAGWASS